MDKQGEDSSACTFLLQVYREFPVRERTSDGQFLKRSLLERLISYLGVVGFSQKEEYHKKWCYHFCSTVIHHMFY